MNHLDRNTANFAIKVPYIELPSDDVKYSKEGLLRIVFENGKTIVDSDSIGGIKDRITNSKNY